MDLISVDPRVIEQFPDYSGVILIVGDLDNRLSGGAAEDMLRVAEREAAASLPRPLTEVPQFAAWRAAFSKFGAKPSKRLCSPEAMCKRAMKGDPLPSISPLVDVYNAVSIAHRVPIGGEDLDLIAGASRLTIAAGDEPFGSDDPEGPRPSEVIWRDDVGVTTRCWNWRQSPRTMVGVGTSNASLVVESVGPDSGAAARRAADDLASALERLGLGEVRDLSAFAGTGVNA